MLALSQEVRSAPFPTVIDLNWKKTLTFPNDSTFGPSGADHLPAAEHQRAIKSDPLSLIDNTNVADGYYAAGQFQGAIEQYRKTWKLDPNFAVASFGLGHAYAPRGMWREAVEAWQKGHASAGNARTAELMARAYTQGGYESALQVWLAEVLAEAHAHYVPATNVALVYARLKDKERTLEWLNKAYNSETVPSSTLAPNPLLTSFVRTLGS